MKIKNISVILIILGFLGLSANVQGASKYIKSEELKNNWPFPITGHFPRKNMVLYIAKI